MRQRRRSNSSKRQSGDRDGAATTALRQVETHKFRHFENQSRRHKQTFRTFQSNRGGRRPTARIFRESCENQGVPKDLPHSSESRSFVFR